MTIRLPGYYVALDKWLRSDPGSRAELFWGTLRDLLRLRRPGPERRTPASTRLRLEEEQ